MTWFMHCFSRPAVAGDRAAKDQPRFHDGRIAASDLRTSSKHAAVDRLLNDPDYNSPHMSFIRIARHTVDEAMVTVVCFSSIGVLGGKAAGKAGVVVFERSAIPG